MALNEIRILLRFRSAPDENCGEVNALLDTHIGHVKERIRKWSRRKAQERYRETAAGQQKRDAVGWRIEHPPDVVPWNDSTRGHELSRTLPEQQRIVTLRMEAARVLGRHAAQIGPLTEGAERHRSDRWRRNSAHLGVSRVDHPIALRPVASR